MQVIGSVLGLLFLVFFVWGLSIKHEIPDDIPGQPEDDFEE